MKRLKLTVVVAACLPFGLQATQGMHAARQFAAEHPAIEQKWFEESNTLVLLSVADGQALQDLYGAAQCKGIKGSLYRDEDLGDDVTAIALEPSDGTRRLCRALSLAMK